MIKSNMKQLKMNQISNPFKHMNQIHRREAFIISKNLLSSFKYAAQGLKYAFASQRNFRIHIFIALFVGLLAIWLELSFSNLAILVITIAIVLILELINTSIEAVVDLSIGRRYHHLARIAKDCAAASVLVSSISSFLIAILLLIPQFLKKFGV